MRYIHWDEKYHIKLGGISSWRKNIVWHKPGFVAVVTSSHWQRERRRFPISTGLSVRDRQLPGVDSKISLGSIPIRSDDMIQ
jgi:hypothetical protein